MKIVFKMALTLMVVEVFYYVSEATNLYFGGQIDSDTQLALAISCQIVAYTHVLMYGFEGASLVLFSKYGKNKKYRSERRNLIQLNMVLGLGLGIAFTATCLLTDFGMMNLFTDNPEVIALAKTYMQITLVVFTSNVFCSLLINILNANGEEKFASISFVAVIATKFVLNLILVVGLGYGIVAMALVTVVVDIVHFAVLAYVVFRKEIVTLEDINIFKHVKPMLKYFKVEVDTRAVLTNACYSSIVCVFFSLGVQALVGMLGDDYQLAFYVMDSVTTIAFCFIYGLSSASSILVTKSFTDGTSESVMKQLKSCLHAGMIGQAIIMIGLLVFREEILGIFNLPPLAYDLAMAIYFIDAFRGLIYLPAKVISHGLLKRIRPTFNFKISLLSYAFKFVLAFIVVLDVGLGFIEMFVVYQIYRIGYLIYLYYATPKIIEEGILLESNKEILVEKV